MVRILAAVGLVEIEDRCIRAGCDVKKPDIVTRIKRFNKTRDPHLLARKYAEMRVDAFAFYRGTCHLFYEDLPAGSAMQNAPLAWISGDLHPENFGSFRGGDGRVYFDVNDFDEANLAPLTWDVLRCLCGLFIGCELLGVIEEDARELCRRYLYAYCSCLASGAPQVLDKRDASGMVRELLKGVLVRPADRLVRARTEKRKGGRRIRVDGSHALRLSEAGRSHAEAVFETWNRSRRRSQRYELVDIAERLAGTGSMGVARYVVLAKKAGALRVLDVKMEPRSSLAPYLAAPQPEWKSEAERCVIVQQLVQARAPVPLEAVKSGKQSFVVKELEPTMDRVRWDNWQGRLERLDHLMSALGLVTASSHLRGAGARGAASAEECEAFARDRSWPKIGADYAIAYAARVQRDYQEFAHAYDRKRFVLHED
jgi:uncharacterized protein (DUF2252 family)